MLWTLLKIDQGRTQTDGPKNKETDKDSQGFTSERRQKECLKEEEDSWALEIV